MNELQLIRNLIKYLQSPGEVGNQQRFIEIVSAFLRQVSEDRGETFELRDLYRVVANVRTRCLERMLPGDQRNIAIVTLDNIDAAISTRQLSRSATSALSQVSSPEYMLLTLNLLNPLYGEVNATELNLEGIEKCIESMSSQVANAEFISDRHRSILSASLDLIRRTTSRLRFGEVTEFQDSVLCAVGRLELTLKTEESATKTTDFVRERIDDLLRLAGLVEIGQQAAGFLTYAVMKQITYSSGG